MRALLLAGLALGLLASATLAQPAAFAPTDGRAEDLPEGPGREETFGLCTACHGFKLVSNQGMSREQWNDSLTWMTHRHGMVDIQGAERDLILDYLAKHYGPKPARAGGFRNPFAPQ